MATKAEKKNAIRQAIVEAAEIYSQNLFTSSKSLNCGKMYHIQWLTLYTARISPNATSKDLRCASINL